MKKANCIESRRRRLLLAAGLLCGLPQAFVARMAFAEESVRIRLGTLAPKGSSYHRALQEMGEKWRKAQGGAATFTVFTDGTQGGRASGQQGRCPFALLDCSILGSADLTFQRQAGTDCRSAGG